MGIYSLHTLPEHALWPVLQYYTLEGCEKFIFLSFFVALGEKLLLIITKQGKYILILSSFRPTTIALKKISVRGKVKIFFSTDVWFMVLKRSVFEIQKQRTKNCNDTSYGYGAIHENVTKLRNCVKRRNFVTFS